MSGKQFLARRLGPTIQPWSALLSWFRKTSVAVDGTDVFSGTANSVCWSTATHCRCALDRSRTSGDRWRVLNTNSQTCCGRVRRKDADMRGERGVEHREGV